MKLTYQIYDAIMAFNILLVDDHQIVRDGLKHILLNDNAIQDVEEARNGHEALIKAGKTSFDAVVIDYETNNSMGMYATKELIRTCRTIKVIMLSSDCDKDQVIKAINAGIKGYLTKDCPSCELLSAIKSVASGSTWFKGKVAEIIAPYLIDMATGKKISNEHPMLTEREKEIVGLVAEGLRSAEIGTQLCISKRTVEVHRANILKKLKLKNLTELIRYAIRENIVKL